MQGLGYTTSVNSGSATYHLFFSWKLRSQVSHQFQMILCWLLTRKQSGFLHSGLNGYEWSRSSEGEGLRWRLASRRRASWRKTLSSENELIEEG